MRHLVFADPAPEGIYEVAATELNRHLSRCRRWMSVALIYLDVMTCELFASRVELQQHLTSLHVTCLHAVG